MEIPKSMGRTGKRENISVELDCLLDTRIATIARLSQTNAKLQLENNYRRRLQDKFEGINQQAYNDLYARRDQLTLSMSFQTKMLRLLREMVFKLTEQAVSRPYHDGATVFVNYWPYKLTPEEIKAYQANIYLGLGRMCQVNMRSIPPSEFTPRYLKSQKFSLVVMYDYDAWLSSHTKSFENPKNRLSDTAMFSPALFFKDELPTPEDIAALKAEGLDPWRGVEAAASPLIELNLLDVEYFSVINRPPPVAPDETPPAETA